MVLCELVIYVKIHSAVDQIMHNMNCGCLLFFSLKCRPYGTLSTCVSGEADDISSRLVAYFQVDATLFIFGFHQYSLIFNLDHVFALNKTRYSNRRQELHF